MIPLVPMLISIQSKAPTPMEELVTLPAGFLNRWVVIEYDSKGKKVKSSASYSVPESGYLKVHQSSSRVPTRVLIKVGLEEAFDGTKSDLVHMLRRETRGEAPIKGPQKVRHFLVFFYGAENQIKSHWLDQFPELR
jgi:SpoU rRNA methylase family enzyme